MESNTSLPLVGQECGYPPDYTPAAKGLSNSNSKLSSTSTVWQASESSPLSSMSSSSPTPSTPAQSVKSRNNYKISLCNFYKKGKCNNGVKCRFAHGTSELRGPLACKQRQIRQRGMSLNQPPVESAVMQAIPPTSHVADGLHLMIQKRSATSGVSVGWTLGGQQEHESPHYMTPFYPVTNPHRRTDYLLEQIRPLNPHLVRFCDERCTTTPVALPTVSGAAPTPPPPAAGGLLRPNWGTGQLLPPRSHHHVGGEWVDLVSPHRAAEQASHKQALLLQKRIAEKSIPINLNHSEQTEEGTAFCGPPPQSPAPSNASALSHFQQQFLTNSSIQVVECVPLASHQMASSPAGYSSVKGDRLAFTPDLPSPPAVQTTAVPQTLELLDSVLSSCDHSPPLTEEERGDAGEVTEGVSDSLWTARWGRVQLSIEKVIHVGKEGEASPMHNRCGWSASPKRCVSLMGSIDEESMAINDTVVECCDTGDERIGNELPLTATIKSVEGLRLDLEWGSPMADDNERTSRSDVTDVRFDRPKMWKWEDVFSLVFNQGEERSWEVKVKEERERRQQRETEEDLGKSDIRGERKIKENSNYESHNFHVEDIHSDSDDQQAIDNSAIDSQQVSTNNPTKLDNHPSEVNEEGCDPSAVSERERKSDDLGHTSEGSNMSELNGDQRFIARNAHTSHHINHNQKSSDNASVHVSLSPSSPPLSSGSTAINQSKQSNNMRLFRFPIPPSPPLDRSPSLYRCIPIECHPPPSDSPSALLPSLSLTQTCHLHSQSEDYISSISESPSPSLPDSPHLLAKPQLSSVLASLTPTPQGSLAPAHTHNSRKGSTEVSQIDEGKTTNNIITSGRSNENKKPIDERGPHHQQVPVHVDQIRDNRHHSLDEQGNSQSHPHHVIHLNHSPPQLSSLSPASSTTTTPMVAPHSPIPLIHPSYTLTNLSTAHQVPSFNPIDLNQRQLTSFVYPTPGVRNSPPVSTGNFNPHLPRAYLCPPHHPSFSSWGFVTCPAAETIGPFPPSPVFPSPPPTPSLVMLPYPNNLSSTLINQTSSFFSSPLTSHNQPTQTAHFDSPSHVSPLTASSPSASLMTPSTAGSSPPTVGSPAEWCGVTHVSPITISTAQLSAAEPLCYQD